MSRYMQRKTACSFRRTERIENEKEAYRLVYKRPGSKFPRPFVLSGGTGVYAELEGARGRL